MKYYNRYKHHILYRRVYKLNQSIQDYIGNINIIIINIIHLW